MRSGMKTALTASLMMGITKSQKGLFERIPQCSSGSGPRWASRLTWSARGDLFGSPGSSFWVPNELSCGQIRAHVAFGTLGELNCGRIGAHLSCIH